MEELKKKIEEIEEKIEKTNESKKKSIEKYNNKIKELNEELRPLYQEYYQRIIEHWKERGEQGLNKDIKYSDIPEVIKDIRLHILNKISGGCTGDWNDGCRGCERDCEGKTDKEWLEMFNMSYHF